MQITQNKLIYLIEGNEASILKGESAIGNVLVPRIIEHESKEFIVTSIKSGCFKFSLRVKSIKFVPDTELKTIGKNAFTGSMIQSITIPSCVTELQDGWCDGINERIKISVMPCKQHNIMFYDEQFILGKSDIKSDKFDILHFAHRDVKNVIIPPFITTISSFAFTNSLLENITVSSNVKKIGECAFACCYNLRNFEIQENSKLKIIGKLAFAGSTIESIKIPSSVCEFEEGWCDGLNNLTSISVFANDEQNISYFNDEFIIGKSDLKSKEYDILILARRDVKLPLIPSFIKRIESHSFAYSYIEKISIPNQISQICNYAFSSCFKLQKVEIEPNSKLESIGKHAFSYSCITSFSIPSSVKQIGEEIFSNCMSLQIIEIDGESQLIEEKTFNFCKDVLLMVPAKLSITKLNT